MIRVENHTEEEIVYICDILGEKISKSKVLYHYIEQVISKKALKLLPKSLQKEVTLHLSVFTVALKKPDPIKFIEGLHTGDWLVIIKDNASIVDNDIIPTPENIEKYITDMCESIGNWRVNNINFDYGFKILRMINGKIISNYYPTKKIYWNEIKCQQEEGIEQHGN